MASTPYVGMPALRRYSPSVAPVAITGTTTTPGHIASVIDSIGRISSGNSGEGALGFASSMNDTATLGSATTSASFSLTAAGDSPGRIRQFTVAVAVCGSALLAWPPSTRVATQ